MVFFVVLLVALGFIGALLGGAYAMDEWAFKRLPDEFEYEIAYTDEKWYWVVARDGMVERGTSNSKHDAKMLVTTTAKKMARTGTVIRRTRPCAVCGKPSEVGESTCSDQCRHDLRLALAELEHPMGTGPEGELTAEDRKYIWHLLHTLDLTPGEEQVLRRKFGGVT